MLIISQLTSGKSVSGTGVSFNLDGTGLLIWVVVLVVYFWAVRKYLGKTVGGWLVSKVLGAK